MDTQRTDCPEELVLKHSLQFAKIEGRLDRVESCEREHERSLKELLADVRRIADAILTLETERRAERSFTKWVLPIVVSITVGLVSAVASIVAMRMGGP